jgi:hypothetical protein
MCVLLFLSLQLMQVTKRLLGIPNDEPEEPVDTWQSADQLFHYAGENVDGQAHELAPPRVARRHRRPRLNL